MVSQNLIQFDLERIASGLKGRGPFSALAHYIAITAWRRLEQSHAPNFHFGAQIDAGKNHEVRCSECAGDGVC